MAHLGATMGTGIKQDPDNAILASHQDERTPGNIAGAKVSWLWYF
jgi:hypothetical protein